MTPLDRERTKAERLGVDVGTMVQQDADDTRVAALGGKVEGSVLATHAPVGARVLEPRARARARARATPDR